MPWPKSCPSIVRFFGGVVFVGGMLIMIQYFGGRLLYGRAIDLGIAFGSGAIALIGLVAISIATCLAHLEERLDRIEAGRSPRTETGRGTRPLVE
jgi:hypothetical protein